jgi:thioredoxin-dependent peroxiredoxin
MESLEGKRAPNFMLPGSDGKTHSLETLKGQTIILYFYPKDDTPGCTKEACGFRDHYAQLTACGANVLGVSPDPLPSHNRFIQKYALPFTLLSDPDRTTMKAYGAWGEKNMYGKVVEGVIRSTVVIGPDGTVLKHWRSVGKAEAHPGHVATYL